MPKDGGGITCAGVAALDSGLRHHTSGQGRRVGLDPESPESGFQGLICKKKSAFFHFVLILFRFRCPKKDSKFGRGRDKLFSEPHFSHSSAHKTFILRLIWLIFV